MKWFVYMVRCSDGSLYTGITVDINKRMKKHKAGLGSKYVRARLPITLVYTEEKINKSDALKREIEIKKMSRKEKLKLAKLFL